MLIMEEGIAGNMLRCGFWRGQHCMCQSTTQHLDAAQTTMVSAQLVPQGIGGFGPPAVVLQGPRELAELAQWMLLQELVPGLPQL